MDIRELAPEDANRLSDLWQALRVVFLEDAERRGHDSLSAWRSAVVIGVAVGELLSEHFDVARMIADGNTSLGVGPILNPTLWRDRHEALEIDLKTLRALRALVVMAEERRAGAAASAEGER